MAFKLPEIINLDEMMAILKHTRSQKHKLAFSLAAFCGLRISEVCKLKPSDYDKSRQMIFIRQGKGNKDRYVPVPIKMSKMMKHLPIGVGHRALQLMINRVSLKAIGKKIKFHTLRHFAATFYLSKGMNIREVQQFLGHSKLDTTMIYTHVNPESLQNKMNEIWK